MRFWPSVIMSATIFFQLTAIAVSEEKPVDIFELSGLTSEPWVDDECREIQKEFVLAYQALIKKAPEYSRAQIRSQFIAEAKKFKQDTEQHVTAEFKRRDSKRRLYNLTMIVHWAADVDFPDEPAWAGIQARYDVLVKTFDAELARRLKVPATVASSLKDQIRGTIKELSSDCLSPTCWMPLNEELFAEANAAILKFIDGVSVHFAKSGRRAEVNDKNAEFVDEATDEFLIEFIEIFKSHLRKSRSRSPVPTNVEAAQARLKAIKVGFETGFLESSQREFAAKNAAFQARFENESSPEAVEAETARLRAKQNEKLPEPASPTPK